MNRKLLLLFFLIAWSVTASSATQLKIVTPTGVVSFVAEDNWPVLSMQTKLPIAAVVFQLPNAADDGTPHSTNLILKFYDNSKKARRAFDAPLQQYGETPQKTESWEGWSMSSQVARQGDSLYTILDAKRSDVGDVSASARLAWPHLPGNPATYDKDMEARFRVFLQSVQGQVGPYTPQAGETVRRPSQ